MKLLLKRSVMTVVAALVSSAFHFKSQRCLLIHFFPSKCLAKFVMFWLLGDLGGCSTKWHRAHSSAGRQQHQVAQRALISWEAAAPSGTERPHLLGGSSTKWHRAPSSAGRQQHLVAQSALISWEAAAPSGTARHHQLGGSSTKWHSAPSSAGRQQHQVAQSALISWEAAARGRAPWGGGQLAPSDTERTHQLGGSSTKWHSAPSSAGRQQHQVAQSALISWEAAAPSGTERPHQLGGSSTKWHRAHSSAGRQQHQVTQRALISWEAAAPSGTERPHQLGGSSTKWHRAPSSDGRQQHQVAQRALISWEAAAPSGTERTHQLGGSSTKWHKASSSAGRQQHQVAQSVLVSWEAAAPSGTERPHQLGGSSTKDHICLSENKEKKDQTKHHFLLLAIDWTMMRTTEKMVSCGRLGTSWRTCESAINLTTDEPCGETENMACDMVRLGAIVMLVIFALSSARPNPNDRYDRFQVIEMGPAVNGAQFKVINDLLFKADDTTIIMMDSDIRSAYFAPVTLAFAPFLLNDVKASLKANDVPYTVICEDLKKRLDSHRYSRSIVE
ncbi:hypothetical protein LSAT2_032674 [Lamellibrachia satsuma]|nr:hypothetical protein LSAT2_032674 [Lamellibrachia satsuma]